MVYVYHRRQDTVDKNLVINQGEVQSLPHKSKINMKQTISLDVAAKKLAKVNDSLCEVNDTIQELCENIVNLGDDFSDRSYELRQSYCNLIDEISAAMMKEAILGINNSAD